MDHNLNQTHSPRPPYSKDHESGREFSRLPLLRISIDGGTQTRAGLDADVIADYAEAIKDGATLPPVIVFYDGNKHWLADGFHRYHATEKAGQSDIDADVRQGTRRDAILHSVGANEEHGLRRTNDDKRRAVQTLLDDAEWSQWPDAEIARAARVGRNFVNRLRNSHLPPSASEPAVRKYINRQGTETTMNVARIGKTQRPGARTVTRTLDPEFRSDPDFQAEAEESARDLEMDQAERLSIGGDPALAADNENLRKQVAALDRRIAALVEENGSLKTRANIWQQRAIDAGWRKGRVDA
jgi:ParB-like chromosome segregation protein Spo0J